MSLVPRDILEEYKSYGIEEVVIQQAWQVCNGNRAQLLDTISSIQEENQKALQQIQSQGHAPQNPQDQDIQMEKAILASIQEAKTNDYSFEPLNPEQRIRKDGVPVGLKNVGNTCYFNSLLQIYFLNFQFVREILSFKPMDIKEDGEDMITIKRQKAGIKLVNSLQKVFVQMIGSNKKYVDPSEVLKNIVDDQGQVLPIGEQKDIGEFMIFFLSTLDEGLRCQEKYHNSDKMQIESEFEGMHFQSIEESLTTSLTSSQLQSPQQKITRQHSSSIRQDSVINNLFFGRSQIKLTYPLGDQIQTTDRQEMFNMIFLDIKFKHMYSAWDEFIINQIDEYKNDKGDLVTAQKEIWVEKSPSTLFFQLKRVYYDVEAQMAKKSNDPFHFEKTIYVDRFMINNNEEYLKIRQKVKQLENEYNKIEETMEKLTKYGEQGLNLQDILGQSSEFLQGQVQNNTGEFTLDPQVQQAIQVLSNYKNQVNDRIQKLQQEMNKIQNEIDQSYNDFKKQPYRLQSILIHDGYGADSGHYYSFLYDFQDDKWRRYNDQNIKEVPEEEVMKEAIGGHGNASAYCLVYVSDDQIIKERSAGSSMPLRSYSILETSLQKPDLYKAIIPQELKQFMQDDNQKFDIEIKEYKTNTLVKNIIDSYIQKFELTNSLKRKSDDYKNKIPHKMKPPALINFCVFLKDQKNNTQDNIDLIVKYHILDTCVRDFHQNKDNLWAIQEDTFLIDKLQIACKNLGQFKQPPLSLSDQNSEYLDTQLSFYMENIQSAVACVYFMEAVVKNNFKMGLYGLCHILTQSQNFQNDFSKLGKDSVYVLMVSALQYVDQLVQEKKDWEEIQQLLKIIVGFHSLYGKENKFRAVVKIWLTDIGLDLGDEDKKNKVEELNSFINDQGQVYQEGIDILNQCENELQEIINKNTHEVDPSNWNMNKQEDVHMKEVIDSFSKYKDTVMKSIMLNKKITDSPIPLLRQERQI